MAQQQHGELDDALFIAAEAGYAVACQRLIQAGVNVNTVASDGGWTPLHLAAANGRDSVCRLLIQAGANVHAVTRYGITPLHRAADGGHVDVCQRLIQAGANVNSVDRNGWTPLHDAVANGYVEVCRLLIERGANVHAVTNDDSWAPLHCAATRGHLDVCRLLIQAGANVNAIDRYDNTLLDQAIEYERTPVLAYFYVHRVADFHQPDHTGRKPWDRLTAQQQGTLTKAMAEHQEKIAILQKKGLPNELARLVMGYV